MIYKVLALDIGTATYSIVIARELKKLGHSIILGIPFNDKIRPEIILALNDYRKILYPDPLFSKHDFTEWIKKAASLERFDFIIPFLEYTQLAVAEVKEELEDMGATIPIPDYHTLKRATDKSYVIRRAIELGLNVPKTLFLREPPDADLLIDELGLPFILKVSSEINVPPGLGSRFYVFKKKPSQSYLEKVFNKLARHGIVIAQEYIEGIGVGVEFLFNKYGDLIAVTGHKRVVEVHREGGYSVSAYTYMHPDAIRQGFKLLRSLNWKGVAMVEFRESKDGRLFFMELNPRFWGTTPLALHSGVNFAQLLVEYFNKRSKHLYYPKHTAYFVSLLRAFKRVKEDLKRNGIRESVRTLLETFKKAKGRVFIAERYEYPLKYFILIVVWHIKRLQCLSSVSRIVDNIYIGPAADNEKILSFIRLNDIECIVDLREDHEIKDTVTLKSVTHGCYFNVPIKDDSAPKDKDFMKVMSILSKLVKEQRKVYIGCRMGRGRSATILLGYLTLRSKKPLPYIYLLLMFKRPIVKLTKDQMEFLYSTLSFSISSFDSFNSKLSD